MHKPVCVVIGIGPMNGAAFARKFANEGYAVALLSRSTDYSTELASTLPDARAYACDVSDPAAVQGAFQSIRADLGEAEVLIYNAGSGTWGNIEEVSAEAFERSWRVNSLGAFLAMQEVIPAMKQRGSGAIVIVGATASLRGKPFTTVFAPAKAAQRSLAQAVARHVGPMGIHVALLILDGGVRNPESDADREAPKHLIPDDIAAAAYQLTQQPRSTWTFEQDLRPYVETW